MRLETLQATLHDLGLVTTITEDQDLFDGDRHLVVPGINIQITLDGEQIHVYTDDGKCHEFNVSQIEQVVNCVHERQL